MSGHEAIAADLFFEFLLLEQGYIRINFKLMEVFLGFLYLLREHVVLVLQIDEVLLLLDLVVDNVVVDLFDIFIPVLN